MEEVRSGHDDEEPDADHAAASGGAVAWDERMDELWARYPEAAVRSSAPDGFPFSVRLPVEVDWAGQRLRLGGRRSACPGSRALACVAAHDHSPDFKWQRNFQVRGDLVAEDDGLWSVIPRKLIGGFELPRASSRARG